MPHCALTGKLNLPTVALFLTLSVMTSARPSECALIELLLIECCVWQVVMTLVSIPLMDRMGRRTLHLYGLGGMFIFSIFITISFLIKASTNQPKVTRHNNNNICQWVNAPLGFSRLARHSKSAVTAAATWLTWPKNRYRFFICQVVARPSSEYCMASGVQPVLRLIS